MESVASHTDRKSNSSAFNMSDEKIQEVFVLGYISHSSLDLAIAISRRGHGSAKVSSVGYLRTVRERRYRFLLFA